MAGDNFLRIRNDVAFSLINPDIIKIQDDLQGSLIQPAQAVGHQTGLQVRIAATHAGIVTRNNGFYLPDRMRKGASSFTDQYQKPVLLHHEDHKDPVGRIIRSGYVDTSGSIQDKYVGKVVRDKRGKEIGTITEQLLLDFNSGKMPFGQQVDVIRNLFKDALLDDNSYDGLGHIQIVANITDQDAISKLLDGRYITGSVGATTDRALCSICKQDWTEDGQCEHKPGGIYDSAKCFIIAGNLFYDEYSFVNVPADRHSKVLELNYNGITDSVEVVDDYKGRVYEVRLEFPQYDSLNQEVNFMGKKTKKVADSTETPEVEVENVTDEATTQETDTSVQDEANPKPDESGETTVEDDTTTEGNTEVQDEAAPAEGEVQDQATSAEPDAQEEKFEDFLERVLTADSMTADEEDKLYDALWAEVEGAIKDGELNAELVGDAKLSSEKRKKLAKSTFCGPNRSFPVPDCAHVTAAKRLIGRYKGEGNKDSIMACVDRKAKAMGCGSSKKSDSTKTQDAVVKTDDSMHAARIMHMVLATLEENQYSGDKAPLADDEKNMLRGILKRLSGVVGKDEFTGALVEEDLAIDPTSEQALCDEVARMEEAVGDLTDQLAAVRKEYTALYQDMETLQDALVEEKTKTRKVQEAHLSTLVTLRDGKAEDKNWTTLTDEGVTSELTRLTDEVDMVKITDKLGDGMSRNPQESVDDPSEVTDNVNQERLSVANIQKIEEHFTKLLFTRGKQAAEAYRARMVREGYLPNPTENN